MTYPIECSDKYSMQGVKDAADLAQWLNSWMHDDGVTRCVIEKAPAPSLEFNPDTYILAPAEAGEQQ